MALKTVYDNKIKYNKIVGTIDNLEEKLNGNIPVDRLELIHLVNSWGRTQGIHIYNYENKVLYIHKTEPKECYNLSKLDTSKITNMEKLFSCCSLFNENISQWNVSNVTDMNYMFYQTKNFNQPIGNWDVSNVMYMYNLFSCSNFNQNISSWNISNVIDISYAFQENNLFNQDIGKWDVSNVTNMNGLFFYAKSFNQNISSWNLNNVTTMGNIFTAATAFQDKYNDGEHLPYNIEEFKEWFKENRDKMNEIDIKEKEGKNGTRDNK